MSAQDDIVWLRDLDGTGSMHPCTPHDPGAVAYVPELLPDFLGKVNNPQAFPFQVSDAAEMHVPEYGASMRDLFAGFALIGLLASKTWNNTGNVESLISMTAFNVADAMLAQREM